MASDQPGSAPSPSEAFGSNSEHSVPAADRNDAAVQRARASRDPAAGADEGVQDMGAGSYSIRNGGILDASPAPTARKVLEHDWLTFKASRWSARVRPRLMAAIGLPASAAACAKRKPEQTNHSDDPKRRASRRHPERSRRRAPPGPAARSRRRRRRPASSGFPRSTGRREPPCEGREVAPFEIGVTGRYSRKSVRAHRRFTRIELSPGWVSHPATLRDSHAERCSHVMHRTASSRPCRSTTLRLPAAS